MKFFEPALINPGSLGLEIRAMLAALLMALIPVQSKPPHSAKDGFTSFPRMSGLVRILPPQNKTSSVLTGKKPVEERSSCSADVELTSRRGGEAGTNRF